jgi:sugar O-acyltransferase (sialic acid O-acetyltransferase NeuD family)
VRKIAIVGAGGLGREVLMLIEHINQAKQTWNFVGFFDDGIESGSMVNGHCVLGGVKALNLYHDDLSIVIAVGSPKTKREIIGRINNKNISFARLIHPGAQLGNSDFITIEEGAIVSAGSVIAPNVHIGKHVFLNYGVIVGHDAVVGDYASVMPSVNINGESMIAAGAYLGVASVIINKASVGENSIIGAGAVVFSAIRPNCTAMGNPAIPIKDNQ